MRFRKWYIGGVSCPEGKTGLRLLCLMDLIHGPFYGWVMREASFPERMKLLDIGTGGGGFPSRLQRYYPYADIDACDISQLAVSRASRKIEGRVFQCPAEALDAQDGVYSVVTALDTVYYWTDIHKAFSEVFRVLSGGGVFYIALGMADKDLGAVWGADNPGLCIYSPDELSAALCQAGFSDVSTASIKGTKALLRAVKKC